MEPEATSMTHAGKQAPAVQLALLPQPCPLATLVNATTTHRQQTSTVMDATSMSTTGTGAPDNMTPLVSKTETAALAPISMDSETELSQTYDLILSDSLYFH